MMMVRKNPLAPVVMMPAAGDNEVHLNDSRL